MACVLGHRAQELDYGSFSSRCAIGLHSDDSFMGSHGSYLKVPTSMEGLITRALVLTTPFWIYPIDACT